MKKYCNCFCMSKILADTFNLKINGTPNFHLSFTPWLCGALNLIIHCRFNVVHLGISLYSFISANRLLFSKPIVFHLTKIWPWCYMLTLSSHIWIDFAPCSESYMCMFWYCIYCVILKVWWLAKMGTYSQTR